MIYRVAYSDRVEGSAGYSYHKSKKSADKAIKSYPKSDDGMNSAEICDIVKTPKTVKDWVRLLNQFGSHNDNG